MCQKLLDGAHVPGEIIAEFGNGHDAANFVRIKGGTDRFTVTPGINLMFAVRPIITASSSELQDVPRERPIRPALDGEAP